MDAPADEASSDARAGFTVRPVARVESPLTDRSAAPKQGYEGSPDAWLVFDPAVHDAMADLRPGESVVVLTWLDRADRDMQRVHPRSDPTVPQRGVFSTRSPDRPNPIGLHLVEIVAVDGLRVRVRNLEAIDGTPVLDVKPQLPGAADG
jgi:tRNA-Thr(GGU) m(6)t(6)A37 methyltransferase TsaA